MKEKILNTIDDLVADFLFYDRKEDEELSMVDLSDALEDGKITVDEIVERFRQQLVNGLEE